MREGAARGPASNAAWAISRTREMVSSGDRSRTLRLGRDVTAAAAVDRVDMPSFDCHDEDVGGRKAADETVNAANERAANEYFAMVD